jgi:hypothetical protein
VATCGCHRGCIAKFTLYFVVVVNRKVGGSSSAKRARIRLRNESNLVQYVPIRFSALKNRLKFTMHPLSQRSRNGISKKSDSLSLIPTLIGRSHT